MSGHRVVSLGDSAVRVELGNRIDPDINSRAVAMAEAMRRSCVPGVRDVVATYRSVAVYFDPLKTDFDRLSALLVRAAEESAAGRLQAAGGRAPTTIPVSYGGNDGPDLKEVAAFAGITEAEAAALHADAVYRVFMMGFVPGFAYLGTVDPRIAVPRRQVPRLRVPAGSVGIAASQTGVYPIETPGGWQIIGRTATRLFDPARDEPFLLKTGDLVRFRRSDTADKAAGEPLRTRAAAATLSEPSPCIAVVKPGLSTTVQDLGRWGTQDRGVPVAGPMDAVSHRLANALVGNNAGDATLEATFTGPELEFEDDRVVAVAGAEFDLFVDGRAQAMHSPFVARAGSRLRFGARRRGSRAYVAVCGGIAVPPVLGSRATHALTRMGGLDGRALAAGDRVPLGRASAPYARTRSRRASSAGLPQAARLRILPGPDIDRFAPDALAILESSEYRISADANRMGYRLEGPPVPLAVSGDIISDATPAGALQVPASGQPLLLMADRQTTGGYPIVAIVISADLSAAGQLGPGDAVRFAACTAGEAFRALIDQERRLMRLEGAG